MLPLPEVFLNMSVEAFGSEGIDCSAPMESESWVDGLVNTTASAVFRLASCLTDPVCRGQELLQRVEMATGLGAKILMVAGAVACAVAAIFTTVPGIALRWLAAQLQPFIYWKGESDPKSLSTDGSFTLLSWNVCFVAGKYTITDGNVVPWHFRIDRVIERIVEKNADVNCIYETFDTASAFYMAERLREHGYAHFYFNVGPRAVGVSSGILVASKFDMANPEFTPFPEDTLVGRTKNATKGVFAFDLKSEGRSFVRVFSTHLQHSEEPAFPTEEEVEGRRRQMEIIISKVNQVRDRCILVTGDLNMDDDEYLASSWHHLFHKGDDFEGKTWGGDAFCAELMEKRVSRPLNLDHTMVINGEIHTTLLETGYDPKVFSEEALSDHKGLYSVITL